MRTFLLSLGLVICVVVTLWIWTQERRHPTELLQPAKMSAAVVGSEAQLSGFSEFSGSPLFDETKGVSVHAALLTADGLNSEALANWAEQNIEGALNWLYEAVDAKEFETAYPVIMHVFAQQMPQEAALILPELRSGFLRDSLMTSISRQWVQSDPNAALDWASNLEDASLSGAAQSAVLLAVCETSYDEALKHVFTSIAEEDRGELLSKVFAHEIMAQRTRTQSGSRLLDLTESSIEKIPEVSVRKQARLEAAQLLVRSHPQVAFTLAERADASDSRERLLLSAFQSLNERDQDYADYLLSESKLNDAIKAELRAANVPLRVEMVIPQRP